MFQHFSEVSDLATIAIRILTVPSSSASVEREFSCQSRIHTKDRNKLSNETVEKLLAVEYNLRFLELDEEGNNLTSSQIQKDGGELDNATLEEEERELDTLSGCSFPETNSVKGVELSDLETEIQSEIEDEDDVPLAEINGTLCSTVQEKIQVWEQHMKELYNDYREEPTVRPTVYQGPEILNSEVLQAIKQLKNNKSPGPDNIYPEILKLISEENVDILTRLFNKIYDRGKVPDDWLHSTFVPLPKKNQLDISVTIDLLV
ncbi:uncharacterized protein LOC115890268 [Sitophilus oryzae]|uniref:Uncharacterized protein LOC115890268 n=1 Tax=Sitophilus oryzae TaxID=7048 RepID=A0A6J2YU32_SITOR|nr:uncharacterized protein LOC115890268 [Sitophilus oryzae]